ncbi:MAG: crotonase [Peptococcaceae bacterium BRH_c4b]|nr:MAG: crotonase [Peptococcaceae bacterium BRH_c4b]
MAWDNILLTKEGNIATITINRPKVLNALNYDTMTELGAAISEVEQDNDIRVLIITGAGEKAFIAGADISYMQSLSVLEARKFAKFGQSVLSKIENLSKPVIAAINGFALGGGCELSMACDMRIASSNAKFGQPEVALGLIAGFGGTQRLTRLVNPGIAKEMLLTGDIYDAAFALKIGLVNHVVAPEELMPFCLKKAELMASRGPVAMSLTKEAINEGLEMDMEKALLHEADLFGVIFATDDKNEGISAFLAKAKPNFKGQ